MNTAAKFATFMLVFFLWVAILVSGLMYATNHNSWTSWCGFVMLIWVLAFLGYLAMEKLTD